MQQNPGQNSFNLGGFNLSNTNDMNYFINNILQQAGLSGGFMNNFGHSGNNVYTNVYSNVNGNRNNFNFNEEIINNNNQNNPDEETLKYEKQLKELKNYKYRTLKRDKYSEYIKKNKDNNKVDHQE